jgi:hypothetical protein
MSISEESGYSPQVMTAGGHTIIGGLSRVFHCNFYNSYLQMAVLLTQASGNHNPKQLLTDSVTPLVSHLIKCGYTEQDLLEEFAYCGFGYLQQRDEKTWETPISHYGQRLCMHGRPQKSCYFTSGYIQGIVDKAVTETACQIEGGNSDEFSVSDKSLYLKNYLCNEFKLTSNIPDRFDFEDCQQFETRVDEDTIKTTVATLPLKGDYVADETALIRAFGVVLTNHFADYYNKISYESYFALINAGIPKEDAEEIFTQAGHICAFNTFGGIMKSQEWYSLVVPQCDSKEDWFHGMIAIVNALGWGVYRVEKLNPQGEIIVRVYNSYEGVGYRRMYSQTDEKNISFLVMGGILGLVHLLWKVDIREKPELTEDFYVNQFNHIENSYQVKQTHAIAAGDEYDRVVVFK